VLKRFRRPRPTAPTTSTQDEFDKAKDRFEFVRDKLTASALNDTDKYEAHNLNEAEYRKTLDRLICTY
jgi:hypothetical protein